MGTSCEPGELFIRIWQIVEQKTPSQRTVCGKLTSPGRKQIQAAINRDSGPAVMQELEAIMQAAFEAGPLVLLATQLEIMRELDSAFYSIHPRSKHSPLGKSKQRYSWLSAAQTSWYARGFYCEGESLRLIPRGPLLRSERDEAESSGDTLADRFSALSVVGTSLHERGRVISVEHLVVSTGGTRGVSGSRSIGHEKVGFLAVAQTPAEVDVFHVVHRSADFLDFKASPSLDVATRVLAGLEAIGETDICLAPELLVSEDAADELCHRMHQNQSTPRLFLAGSGHTRSSDDAEMQWNEARVVNHAGAELWRQRKLWQASTTASRGRELGLSLSDGDYFEFNASDEKLYVVDVEPLGRCAVLICQDLEAEPLSADLFRKYQPDWIFVPIMDSDVSDGRWAHRGALASSDQSRARFLMVTNTAYAKKMGWSESIVMGLAVGPQQSDTDDGGRLCAPLLPETAANIEFAKVQWRSGCSKWKKSTVKAE